MKKDNQIPMVLGLDVGTSRIVAARRTGEDTSTASQLNAFVNVPYAPMTEKALTREEIPYERRGSELLVHGNEAPRFADFLNVESRRPMTLGVLNSGEREALAVVRTIITNLVGDLPKGDTRPRVAYSVPAVPLSSGVVTEEGLTYHEATLKNLLEDLGFETRSITEGLAVIYSELEDTNYTGIGISCGGGLCNVSLAYLSMPAISFSTPKAGDYIDSSTAAVTGDLATRVRLVKEESFHFNGNFTDKLLQAVNVYYDDMIQTLIAAMKEAFSNSRRMPKLSRPVPIVLSGGTATPKGFRERFERALTATEFPIAVSEIRMANDPLTATARGALISVLAEG
ncbi:MAG: hypothetical protein IT163_16965 [Bryobacterales bacterium]|nr:hypothetical protein [Bryobacterales bacterium]